MRVRGEIVAELFSVFGTQVVKRPRRRRPADHPTYREADDRELPAMLHDRMPVILDPAEEAAWLDPATPEPLLRELLVSCLDPPAAEAEPTLF